MICCYKYCNHHHDTNEISDEKFIRNGNKFFHEDCYKTKSEITEIEKIFLERINSGAVIAQLRSVINSIVFNKGFGSEYLLFGLNYYIEHKIKLNYPQGLYYVVQNKDVKSAYDSLKAKELKQKMKDECQIEDENVVSFSFKQQSKKSICDIIGGKDGN